jgi:uncharacterized coiled-coil DUF342 family protein
MIDPEVMAQIRALSEEAQTLREDISHLAQKLDGNNANLTQYMERELGTVRDAATRATQSVAEFAGRLQSFTDEQNHFKRDFEWWAAHLDKLTETAEAAVKRLVEAEAKLERDNETFKDWATTKVNMIGRIFRR